MPIAVSQVQEIDINLAFKAESIARRFELLRKKSLRKVLPSEFYESVHSNVKALTIGQFPSTNEKPIN